MSPSWNRLILVRVMANNVVLERWRIWPRTLLETSTLASSGADLAATLLGINAHLDQKGWRGKMQLELSSRWLRFGVLPWPLQSGNDERDALVTAGLLVAQSPQGNAGSADDWKIRLGPAHYGQDRLYVGISPVNAAIISSLDTPSRPLQFWQPQLMQAWNRHRHHFTQPEGIVCVAEPGQLSLISFTAGRISNVRLRQFPAADTDSLISLLRMEQLRQEGTFYIVLDDLPIAWHKSLSSSECLLAGHEKPTSPNEMIADEPAS